MHKGAKSTLFCAYLGDTFFVCFFGRNPVGTANFPTNVFRVVTGFPYALWVSFMGISSPLV